MNYIGKRIAGIAIIGLIGIGFLTWRDSTPRKPTQSHTEQVVKADKDTPTRRRTRTGPRKPPAVSPIPPETHGDPIDEDDPSEKEAPEELSHDEDLTEKERKLEEYLEHLEAIPDPNVDELTMLGEMAFDANEAEAAYEHYLEVIEEHTDDPNAAFALYKLAWAEYNLGDVEAAINDMELMMEWVGDGETQLQEILHSQGPADLDLFRNQTN